MKNSFFLLVALLFFQAFKAQIPPQKFNYSAVARNSAGDPIANTAIGIQITILRDSPNGAVQYSENHMVNTDAFGLFNLIIGTGNIQSGNMALVDWTFYDHFLKVGMDVTGGTNFLTMGTSQFLSVPYAMHARSAEYAQFSNTLLSPLLGAYRELIPDLLYYPAFITYLDHNKVLLKLDFQLRTDIDPNNGTFDFKWCGVVSGNTISFPQELNLGSAATMNATINNNTLNINVFFASDPSYIYNIVLNKEP